MKKRRLYNQLFRGKVGQDKAVVLITKCYIGIFYEYRLKHFSLKKDNCVIRDCTKFDFDKIYEVINDAATAYRGVIPGDCWKEPYMPLSELRNEISAGVQFFGEERKGNLIGVMGKQFKGNAILLRHAYVKTAWHHQGVGSKLLCHLLASAEYPVLIGTWAAAHWAVRFYEKHGFTVLTGARKDDLLKKYWSISARQTETSIVLADPNWISANLSPQKA